MKSSKTHARQVRRPARRYRSIRPTAEQRPGALGLVRLPAVFLAIALLLGLVHEPTPEIAQLFLWLRRGLVAASLLVFLHGLYRSLAPAVREERQAQAELRARFAIEEEAANDEPDSLPR